MKNRGRNFTPQLCDFYLKFSSNTAELYILLDPVIYLSHLKFKLLVVIYALLKVSGDSSQIEHSDRSQF